MDPQTEFHEQRVAMVTEKWVFTYLSDSRVTAFSLSLSCVCVCTCVSRLWAAEMTFIVFSCTAYHQWHHHTCSSDSLVSTATVPMIPLTWPSLSAVCLRPVLITHTHTLSLISQPCFPWRTWGWQVCSIIRECVFECLTHAELSMAWCANHTHTHKSVWIWDWHVSLFDAELLCGEKPTSLWLEALLLCAFSHKQTHTYTVAAESRDGSDIYRLWRE